MFKYNSIDEAIEALKMAKLSLFQMTKIEKMKVI